MSDISLLRPELLWLAVIIIPLMVLATRRLRALAPWRRRTSLLLQIASVVLLLITVAEPALVKPDNTLSVVVVLDASGSLSDASRQEAVDYAKAVQAGIKPTDSVRFVATGREAVVLTPEQVTSGAWAKSAADADKATDLAAGLRLAGSLLGDAGRRRVVLISDGWETRGQVADEASRLAARNIDLQVAGMTALGKPEVVVERLTMQPYARIGDTVTSDLHVYSTDATSATLSISVDGALISGRSITLQAGDNSIPIEQRAAAEGFHKIEVSIASGADTTKENNSAVGTLVVKTEPNVLVLEERLGEADRLADALGARQMKVDVRLPSAISAQVQDLDAYDSIVLNNVAATSFSLDQQRTIQEYVRRSGRGLVVVGGKTSYGKGDYLNSAFEEVLPVSSRPAPRPQEGQTALVLIVDRSSSMRDFGSNSDVNKFEMAIQATRLAVDSLRAGDTIGVIAFDDEFEWAVPVQQIKDDRDKDRIKQLVSEIEMGRTTSIFPAVEEAARAIRSINVPTRHLVLLTDGREQAIADYGPLLDRLRADNTNLSAIAIGADSDRELLTRLARDGRGRYYFTEQPENIPKIVFKEIDLTLREAILEGTIQPHLSAPSPVLRGLTPQDVPQLTGYDITVAKDDAVIALTTDAGDPLLAHWNYGLGRVVAFTSEAGSEWAGKWLTWTEFGRFWDQAVRWTMASPASRLVQPSVTFSEDQNRQEGVGTAHISVESLNADNTFADLADITAGLRSPSGAVTTTLLTQTAPGRYEADVPVGEQGAYEVRVRRDGAVVAGETTGFSVPTGLEYLRAGTNDRLLKRLNGGKAYLRQPEQVLDTAGLAGASPEREPFWPFLLAPALLLLLASVAVRRIDFRLQRGG
ncbi:MAG: VWA domain-containing protein [Chloroflexota bacterium]